MQWGNQEPCSLSLEQRPACSLHSVLTLPGLDPKRPINQDSPAPGVASPLPGSLRERRRRCPQRSCNLVGNTAIFLKESAAILLLWVSIAFQLLNNKKTQSPREWFLLGMWVGRRGRELGIRRSVVVTPLRLGGQLMGIHCIIEKKLQLTEEDHVWANSASRVCTKAYA